MCTINLEFPDKPCHQIGLVVGHHIEDVLGLTGIAFDVVQLVDVLPEGYQIAYS